MIVVLRRLYTYKHYVAGIKKQINLPVSNLKTCCSFQLSKDKLYLRNYCTDVKDRDVEMILKEPYFNVLSSYGFSVNNVNAIIKTHPDINKLNPKDILHVLNNLSRCQFTEDEIVLLVLKHPNLLFIEEQQIHTVYIYIANIFRKKDIFKIFLNTPQLLMDSVDIIKEKLLYLEEVMQLPRTQIINSFVFGHSLHHIKERHEFLKRVGVYKKLDPKKKTDYVNPKLDYIFSSSDEEFSTKIAHVSLFEYEVFKELFISEIDD